MRRFRILAIALALALGAALTPISAAQAAGPRPVVFVHGYSGSSSNWTSARSVFAAAGYTSSQLFAYEYNSYGNNVRNAQGLASFVSTVKQRTGASKVDIVNHSMGGMVSLWYLKQLGGAASVAHLASLAGANHGTTVAVACVVFVTCQQMIPGSSFLDTLASGDETPGSTRYGTWYSRCDGVIIPYTSTVLSGATNNQASCQTHLGFLADTRVLGAVRSFLAT